MTLHIPIGYANCTFVFRQEGATRDATFGLGIFDTSEPALDPATIGTQMIENFTDATAPGAAAHMSQKWTFKGVNTTYQDVSGPIVYNAPTTVVGTQNILPPPSNTSLLITKGTGSGGRKNKGRVYCPVLYPGEDVIDQNGMMTGSPFTNLQGYWTAFLNLCQDSLLFPVLFHNDVGDNPTVITSFTVQSQVATQRRRMRR